MEQKKKKYVPIDEDLQKEDKNLCILYKLERSENVIFRCKWLKIRRMKKWEAM